MIKDKIQQLNDILKYYPHLNSEGICYNTDVIHNKSKSEIDKLNRECRLNLENRKDTIINISKVLQKYIIPTKTIRKFYSSYQMKNIIEGQLINLGVDEFYISNGELIAAALLAGFKIKQCSHPKWHVYFNMQQKSFEQTFHKRK